MHLYEIFISKFTVNVPNDVPRSRSTSWHICHSKQFISHHLNVIENFTFFTSRKMRQRFVYRVSAPYLCTTLLIVLRINEFSF